MSATSTHLSIIIVTYNAAEVIGPCLDSVFASIRASRYADSVEVIVADNRSTDGTVDGLEARYPEVCLHANETNLGFAAAVNRAAKIAEGVNLLFLNPDTVISATVLDECLLLLDWLPQAGGCSPMFLHPDGSPQPSAWHFPSLPRLALEMFLPFSISSRLLGVNAGAFGMAAFPVDSVSGAALMVRKNAFLPMGGFDEQFYMYCEDIDFCLRAKKAGYSIYFVPAATVYHRQGASAWKQPRMLFSWLYSSKLKYFRKHRSVAVYTSAFFVIITGLCYKILVYTIAGLINKNLRALAQNHLAALPAILRTGISLLVR